MEFWCVRRLSIVCLGFIALGVTGVLAVQVWQRQPLPAELTAILSAICGYLAGTLHGEAKVSPHL